MNRTATFAIISAVAANSSGGGGGASDYEELTNKPSINGNTLSGNKTSADLGIPLPSSTTPADLGTASAGASASYARADHVHTMPTAADVGAIATTAKGAASGVAELDASGHVPTTQLADSGVTAGAKGDTTAQTPGFGGTFKAVSGTVDAKGRLTAFGEHTVKIPDTAATTSTAGLMSSTDKTKLDGISSNASGLSAVSLPVTVAGNPVASFTADAAGRTLNPLLVQIDPVQADGTLVDGEVQPPSPTNVRAITGWTGVNITVSPTANAQDGTIYAAAFPSAAGTVYGGTLDAAKGVLTVTHKLWTLKDMSWTGYSGMVYSAFPGRVIVSGDNLRGMMSNVLKFGKTVTTGSASVDDYTFNPFRTSDRIYIKVPNVSTADFPSWCNTNNAVLLTPMADPAAYSLTPAQVTTLLGANNVWADCGAVTVTYPSGTGTPVITSGNLDAPGSAVSFETFWAKYRELSDAIVSLVQEGGT